MAGMHDSLREKIRRIEQAAGYLSPLQNILLTTDGSVTALLESICGDEISVSTLSQVVSSAREEIAAALEIGAGELVNHRVVTLNNRRTGEVLVYAISYTPLSRLEPEFRDDLMRADIPIGRILKKHNIESRREILEITTLPPGETFSRAFKRSMADGLLMRRYRVIRHKKPLMVIEEIFPVDSFSGNERIIIEAPARIHLGLIDLSGAIGRVDGGIGLTLDHPHTVIEAVRTGSSGIIGGDEELRARAINAMDAIMSRFGLTGGVQVTIHAAPPRHAGLGSGTALALSVARAVCELYGISLPSQDLARLVGRGGTSGIGTAAFASGGFILDGGHSYGEGCDKVDFRPSAASPGVRPAPVICRHAFPADWQVLLVIPSESAGASGHGEVDIFREFCPVPEGEVREICHEVVMRMLPGIAEHDIALFGAAVQRIQEIGFKKIEISCQKPVVRDLISGLCGEGAACAGMSSFGPTVYAITENGTPDLEEAAREILGGDPCTLIRTGGRNRGADMRWTSSRLIPELSP